MDKSNIVLIKHLDKKLEEAREAARPFIKAVEKLEDEKYAVVKLAEKDVLKEFNFVVDILEDCGAEYVFVDFEKEENDISAFEDDGTWHVQFGMIRGCFDSKSAAKKAMKKLNMPYSLIKE